MVGRRPRNTCENRVGPGGPTHHPEDFVSRTTFSLAKLSEASHRFQPHGLSSSDRAADTSRADTGHLEADALQW